MAQPTHTLSPETLRQSLAKDGYVLIPNLITEAELQTYRSAAHSATDLARNGSWPYIRTLPKQFPPWPTQDRDKGIWGVQHLLHPSMPAQLHQKFAESYFHPAIILVVTQLLQCKPDELVLELYNLLVRPDQDFQLRWHRDDIPPHVSAVEEQARLAEPMLHAQWNLALYPDSSLIIVPGSHLRARTEIELTAAPFEAHLPEQIVVHMNAGDVVFYNNNILHRGVYDCEIERMTLHGSMGMVGADAARARNILQHGIGEWVAQADFGGLGNGMGEVARAMQSRLMEMGRGGGDVGFSQDD